MTSYALAKAEHGRVDFVMIAVSVDEKYYLFARSSS